MEKIDKRGICWFLLLTFGSTYLVEFSLFLADFSFIGMPPITGQLIVALAMFIPGISAFIVRKWITKEGFKNANLQLGAFKYYVQVYLTIPIIFALIYGLTWIFIKAPDWSLQAFLIQYHVSELPLPPVQILVAIFVSTITFAPFINSIPAFGEEFGWRGYLLPKLLPLGKTKALVLSGFIWGLWHAPLILMGFKYGQHHFMGIILFSILLVFIGIYIGELTLRSKSVILAGFIHGVFNAQAYGIWTVIFPSINPLIGGVTGIIGIFVFACTDLLIQQKHSFFRKRNPDN